VGWYLPLTAEVEIEPDRVTRFTASAVSGGRVSCVVHVPEGAVREFRHSDVTAKRPGRADQKVHPWTTVMDDGVWGAGIIAADRPSVSEYPLEPGTYTLLVKIEGFRPTEALVNVVANATANCELWLEPE
jgi:hypothetical protein